MLGPPDTSASREASPAPSAWRWIALAVACGSAVWFCISALLVFDGRSLLDQIAFRLPSLIALFVIVGWYQQRRRGHAREQSAPHRSTDP
jgi:hypothetical protein